MKPSSALLIIGAAVCAIALSGFNASNRISTQKTVNSEVSDRARFTAWAKSHGITFASPKEMEFRLANFLETDEKIKRVNSQQKDYEFAHNAFSHMSDDEFRAKYAGAFHPEENEEAHTPENVHFALNQGENLKDSVNWIDKNAVNPVQDQKTCQAGYALAAAAAFESIWFIGKRGPLPQLSSQQILDCSTENGNKGCDGGNLDNAYTWVTSPSVRGFEKAERYPYTAKAGTCQFDHAKVVCAMGRYFPLPKDNCEAMMGTIANQPVPSYVDAASVKSYSKGVFTDENCGTSMDQAVLIVGFDTDENGTDYWLIQNSWGTSWGEKGLMKLGRKSSSDKGLCNICAKPVVPTLFF